MPGFPAEVPPPGQRFVRLRHPDSPGGAVTATFLAAPPAANATATAATATAAAEHPLVTALAAREPDRAARVAEGLRGLREREDEVLTWLEAEPAHATAFAHDPLTAIHSALPDLPQDYFDGWTAAPGA